MTTSDRPFVAVVDDDDAVRDSLRFLLEVVGHRVRGFASAAEFLADRARPLVRCLVVDQHMPGMTGLDMLDLLNRAGALPRTLLMTSEITPVLRRRAAALGVASVLEKPLATDSLLGFVAGNGG